MSIKKEQILEYIENNHNANQKELAYYFGVDIGTMKNIIRKYDIKINTGKGIRYRKIEEEELRKYIKEKPETSIKQLAEHFKVSNSTILNSLKKYNIEREGRRLKSMEKKDIVEYLNQNSSASARELAERFGVDITTMYKYINRYGLIVRKEKRGRTKKINEDELRLYIEKRPDAKMKEIAEHFSVSHSTIKAYLNKYNINRIKTTRGLKKEDIETYIEKHPDTTRKELAGHFGVDITTIDKNIHKYAINLKKETPGISESIDVQELREYIEKNPTLSLSEIAKHFGTAHSTIGTYVRKYGIERATKPKGRKSNIKEEDLKKYVIENPNMGLKEIAKHFGVHISTIGKLLKLYNIEREDLRIKDKKEVEAMIDEYLLKNKIGTPREIARALDISEKIVYSYMEKRNMRTIKDFEIKSYIMVNGSQITDEMTKYFGVGKDVIEAYIEKYGIDIQECDERQKKFAQGLVDLFYSKPKLSIERVEKGLNERYNIPISVRKILERYLNILKENNETEEVSIVENLLEKRIKSDIEGR